MCTKYTNSYYAAKQIAIVLVVVNTSTMMGVPTTIESFFDIQVCDLDCRYFKTRDPNSAVCDDDRMVFDTHTFFEYDSNVKTYRPLNSTKNTQEGSIHIVNTASSNNNASHNVYCVNAKKISRASLLKSKTNTTMHVDQQQKTYYCPTDAVGYNGFCFKDSIMDQHIYYTCFRPEASNMDTCDALSEHRGTSYEQLQNAQTVQSEDSAHMLRYKDQTMYCSDPYDKIMGFDQFAASQLKCIPRSTFMPYIKALPTQACHTTLGRDCILEPVPVHVPVQSQDNVTSEEAIVESELN